MNKNRIHLVVANYQRLSCFVENFEKVDGFNPEVDSVYIFDCSPEFNWRSELILAQTLCKHGLVWNKNIFFIRRRNWCVNHGAQLDYFRAILDGLISPPRVVAFMQEHFLDLKTLVKEDTIPEHTVYNVDRIVEKFESDPQVGCVFHTRYGVRVATSNPVIDNNKEFFGDSDVLLDRSTRRGFLIDGGNFIVRPDLYLRWFAAHPGYLTAGDGSYGFSHVWEARLGQILYDQKIKWCDLDRNLEYTTITELDLLEKNLSNKVSKLWYDHRIWYFFYGRDQQVYWPLPMRSFIRYLKIYLENQNTYPKDTTLTFEKL